MQGSDDWNLSRIRNAPNFIIQLNTVISLLFLVLTISHLCIVLYFLDWWGNWLIINICSKMFTYTTTLIYLAVDGNLPKVIALWFGIVKNVEGLYCKRPIQCLASSELLTPHPLTRRVCTPPPRLWYGGRTHSLGGEGVGVNSLEDARHCSVLYICNYFVVTTFADFPPDFKASLVYSVNMCRYVRLPMC